MGKIKKILENELVGGTQSTDVYPITSTKAVYDENNERLDNILGGLWDKIGIFKNAGYLYAGVATPTTDPGTPKAKVFYIANGKGTYNNFGGIEVTEDEVIFLYWDSLWHKVSTGIASQGKLTELKEKVNALALGAFYGYFPDSSFLPTNVTTLGYAYVGLGNPYKIWNFNGKSWSDSGTSIDMNDADEEDITRNAEGKLQFKNRTYGDGMGYVILRKDKTFAEQVTQVNTIYEIRYDFDFNGAEINIPEGCVLKFIGGSLSNGRIVFNNTVISSNNKEALFANVEIQGQINNKDKYAHWFKYKANHDDWNLISVLFNSSGNVYLEPRTYNVDKSIHTSEFIALSSNLNVYGCENCELNANHTNLQAIDTLFLLNNKTNIKFDNIRINCTIGTKIKPPTAHGDDLIDSSGLYIFAINNYCVGITLKNIVINNAAYAVKTSKNADYNNDVYFKDITIENCEFICDMPIQGTNYSNLVCKNSRFLSRGTNSGNHAVYILPIANGNYSKDAYFDNCYFYSPEKDGHIIQIYQSGDTHDLASVTTFTNCLIEGESGACITASSSAKIMLNNCTIKNINSGMCGASGGYIIAYNCIITNIEVSKNWELHQCTINISLNNLIVGNDVAELGHPVTIQNCSINVTSGKYLIYNYTDAEVPVIQNSIIKCNGDGVLSVRGKQQNNIKFINCIIQVKTRLVYSPGKQGDIIISFINCVLSTTSPSYLLNTGSEAVKIDIVNCSLNGDIINIPASPINVGTSLGRPTNKGVGQIFFDTALNKPIWWDGTKWVSCDNENADIKKSGAFSAKPIPSNVGFEYFNTDTHKMITWDGSKWWNPDGTEATN